MVSSPTVSLTVLRYQVAITDAATNPSTNFGNRRHSSPAPGRAEPGVRSVLSAK